jgi:SulP family sulfate permease
MALAGADAPACPQLAMLRLRGSIYFGAVEHVREQLRRVDEEDPRRKWLLLVAQGINFVDLAGAQMLAEEARRRRALGGGLLIVGAQPAVHDMLLRSEEIAAIGAERLIAHKGDALRAVYRELDADLCRNCTVRAFSECQATLPDGTSRSDLPPTTAVSVESLTPARP